MGKKPLGKAGDRAARPLKATGKPRGRNPKNKPSNSAPGGNLDFQDIPFKLREIMKSRLEMKNPKKKMKKNQQQQQQKPAERPGPQNEEVQTDIPVPKFRRGQYESERAYLNRMDQETRHVLFLSRNQPDRQPEMELDEKGELPEKPETPQETKKQKSDKKKEFDRRRLDKFVKKKEEKKVTRLEEEMFRDRVAFGEVAMEPPALTVKPKKSAAATKPGQKQLFLKKLLDERSGASHPAPAASMARKRMVEEERERVVKAYRELKKRKLQQDQQSKPSKRHHT